MKKRSILLGSTLLSVSLIVALSGCGGDASSSTSIEKVGEAKKVSPIVSQSIPPYEMPNLSSAKVTKSLKASRAEEANSTVVINASAQSYKVHDVATIAVENMPKQLDWVGLFKKGDDITYDNLLSFEWVGAKDSVDLKIANTVHAKNYPNYDLESGEYYVIAFTEGNAMEWIAETTVTVDAGAQSNFNPTITLGSSTNYSGQSIPLSLTGLTSYDGEFVGIFPKGAPNDLGAALEWEWTSDILSGEISGLHGVPTGEYELRVYYDQDMELETKIDLTIQAQANVDTKLIVQGDFIENQRVVVNFSGMPGNQADTIAIYNTNNLTNPVTLEWTDGRTSGSVSLDPVPAGEYIIKAFHQGNTTAVVEKSITVAAIEVAEETCKVLLFADEHDPHNKLIAIDYANMEKIEYVGVLGSLTHHADVVSSDFLSNGGIEIADHVLMVPKGSNFINVYSVQDRTFIKKINLPFKPRSADAFNKNKNLILLTAANRPAAVIIDASTWTIVGQAGMNISCDLKFNHHNYFPWYYKSVVYKNYNINSNKLSCIAPDFGGQNISGHPRWLDNNHFAILDRANRMVHIYKLVGQDKNGQWTIKLSGSIRTSTSLHQIIPDPDNAKIFYGMTEGNGNGANGLNTSGIAPVMYKWKLQNGTLVELGKTSLITTASIQKMKVANCYTAYTSFCNIFINAAKKNYYNYCYPTYTSKSYSKYYPTNYSTYYNNYFNIWKSFWNLGNYLTNYTTHVPETIRQQYNSLGGHNLYISPVVNSLKPNGQRYLWGPVASGQAFVVDPSNMKLIEVVKAGKGAGHINFQQNKKHALITNHKSRNVTVVNYRQMKWMKDITLPYAKAGYASTLQSHSPYITTDDKYFHNAWSDGGVFFRINLDTLSLDSKNVNTGGVPIQGNYYTKYLCGND